jgi:uncharacterized damage-inducible protein DinB
MAESPAAKIERFLLRELGALRRELEAYPDERLLWALPPGLPNAAGTLALHLAGNLSHYIGAHLGGSGYVRDREEEFAARDIPRAAILDRLAAAEEAIRTTLPSLSEERLAEPYPEEIRGHRLETGDFLVHLAVHLGYHLGQVSYHRRLVTGDARGVDALDPGELRPVG